MKYYSERYTLPNGVEIEFFGFGDLEPRKQILNTNKQKKQRKQARQARAKNRKG